MMSDTEETQPQRIDLDDAFSDGDDDGKQSFEFTSDVMRRDIAQSMSSHYEEASSTAVTWDNGRYDDDLPRTETSISTLDIGRRVLDFSHSASPSSETDENNVDANEQDLDAQFSAISLSESMSPPLSNEHINVVPQYSPNGHELDNTEQHPKSASSLQVDFHKTQEDEVAPYPNIIIDASASPSSRVHYTDPIVHDDHPGAADASSSTGHSPPSHSPSPSLSEAHSIQSAPNAQDNGAGRLSNDIPSLALNSTPSVPLSPTTAKFHRQTKSTSGPTALQKVISKTRPSFLPPKSRQEDDKHMSDWNAMMKLSRIAAEKRRVALQERRAARERRIQETLPFWEREIVPDWRIVNKNAALRRVWWNGIPTKLRATMWEQAVGNPLALNKDTYRTCLARAKRALSRQTFPIATLQLMEKDIESTLPALHIFHRETGPMYQDLYDMLCAWVVARSDEGLGYTMGIAKIAAMVLLNMPENSGFIVMRNLLERHCMRSFYGGAGSKDDVEAYYRIFDTLLADGMPKIYFNFKQHQVSPSLYLPDWLIPLFLDHLPFEACVRVWDVFILEGDSFLYRASLAMLAVLEPRLFFPDRKELLELLRGENKAALDIARREGQRLDGGKYEIYGLDEESLWERIDSMEEWWKESTWTRLIQRELPDL